MAESDANAVERTRADVGVLGRSDLLRLLEDIRRGEAEFGRLRPDWLLGAAFEALVLRAFALEDTDQDPVRCVRPFRVTYADVWPDSASRDALEEIDGAIHTRGHSCLLECKAQAEVNIEPIAKLRSQLLRRPAGVVGCLFYARQITQPARILARFMAPQCILVWSPDDLTYGLEHARMVDALGAKLRRLAERGEPDALAEDLLTPT